LLSNGSQSDHAAALEAAQAAKSQGIVVLSVANSQNSNLTELQELTSGPSSAHLVVLGPSTQKDYFESLITDIICQEPQPASKQTDFQDEVGLLQSKYYTNIVQAKVSGTGVTLAFKKLQGSIDVYASLTNPRPSKLSNDFQALPNP
jgi:hypothetical protein